TAFSAEQISTLESSFQRQQYLGAAERRQLAGRMRLSEVQVSIKTWFQNRRMKLKRQLQELRTEPFCGPALPYGPQGAVVPLPFVLPPLRFTLWLSAKKSVNFPLRQVSNPFGYLLDEIFCHGTVLLAKYVDTPVT
uniref:Homeobox domain-containing protein n=1 Tax=Ficedula albicollis TaxID=59894 RepID=A0A803VAT3_FICAL